MINIELIILAGFSLSLLGYVLFDFHYAFNHDTLRFTYTGYSAMKEQLTNGIWPFWNPYDGLGMPLFFGGSRDLLLVPLLCFFSTKSFIVLAGFCYLFAGVYFMHKFLETVELPMSSGLVAATIWGFNAFSLWHLHELYFQVVLIFVPLNLLFIHRIHTNRNRLSSWLFLLLINILQLQTGRWDCYEHSTLIALLYIIVVCSSERENPVEQLKYKTALIGAYATSVVAAFLILAPFSFNYLDIILRTARDHSIPTVYFSIRDFVSIIIPNFSIYGSMYYIPAIVLPFLLISLTHINRLKAFAVLLILLHFITAYPTGVWDTVRLLPFHGGHVDVRRSIVLVHLGIALLSGFSLSEFQQNPSRYRWILYISLFLFSLLFLGVSVRKFFFNRLPELNYFHHVLAIGAAIGLILFLLMIKTNSHRTHLILHVMVISYIILFSALFNMRDISDGDLKKWENEFFGGIDSPLIRFLKKGVNTGLLNDRVLFLDGYHPTYHASNSLESLNYYYPLPSKRIQTLASKILGTDTSRASFERLPDSHKFYKMSSIKFKIKNRKSADLDSTASFEQVAFADSQTVIVEDPAIFERIRFLDRYKVIDSDVESAEFIAATPIEWFADHFVVSKDPFIDAGFKKSYPSLGIVRSLPGDLLFVVESTRDMIMILNNAYDRGWQLNVDGKTDPIYRVNFYFQGIKIKKGKHHYSLHYAPPNWVQLSFVSMAAFAGICILCLVLKFGISTRHQIDLIDQRGMDSRRW